MLPSCEHYDRLQKTCLKQIISIETLKCMGKYKFNSLQNLKCYSSKPYYLKHLNKIQVSFKTLYFFVKFI